MASTNTPKLRSKLSVSKEKKSSKVHVGEASCAAGDSKISASDATEESLFIINNDEPEVEDVEVLRAKISELESKCKVLRYDNEKLHLDLAHEKHKVMQLERNLQFVKDNQTTFEKLRETYVNMKYNESAGRKLVEIRDKSVQTWDGILCRACLDTEKIRSQLETARDFYAKYQGCLIIRQTDVDKIRGILQLLKCLNEVQDIDIDVKDLELITDFSNEKRLVGSDIIKSKLRLLKLEENKKLYLAEQKELIKHLFSEEDVSCT